MKKIMVSMFSLALLVAVALPSYTFAAPAYASKNCVTLYQYKNYKGKSKVFCNSVKNLKKFGFDNKTSSIKVKLASGKKVIFYNDANYGGKEGSFLVDESSKMSSLPPMFDNKISSIKFK
jgi:hypothetical protein